MFNQLIKLRKIYRTDKVSSTSFPRFEIMLCAGSKICNHFINANCTLAMKKVKDSNNIPPTGLRNFVPHLD